jgi:KDO2-lipid IV(A) lauroyltransferase
MLPLLRILARLPLALLHGLGGLLGLLALPLRRRSADLLANLRQAGMHTPGMVLRAAAHLGAGMAELPAVWLRPLPRTLGLVRDVRGWEHVEAARAAGLGVIALTPHLGCWELGGIYIGSHFPITFLYRPPRQDWADRLMRQGRERGGVRLATPDTKGVRAMLTALKRGEAVGILPDQVASKGDGVWADFFGRPAFTPTLTHRLAHSTGAVPLLFVCERLAWGRGFRLWVEPLPAVGDDTRAFVAALNRAIETLIRRWPAQYLWTYRRYKAPGGAPPMPERQP